MESKNTNFTESEYDYITHCAKYGRKPTEANIPEIKLKKLSPEQIKLTLDNNENNVAQTISILTHGNIESPSKIINDHRKKKFNKNVLPFKGTKLNTAVAQTKSTIQQVGKTLGRID